MLSLTPSVRILLCLSAVDCRKSFDSLAALVHPIFRTLVCVATVGCRGPVSGVYVGGRGRLLLST